MQSRAEFIKRVNSKIAGTVIQPPKTNTQEVDVHKVQAQEISSKLAEMDLNGLTTKQKKNLKKKLKRKLKKNAAGQEVDDKKEDEIKDEPVKENQGNVNNSNNKQQKKKHVKKASIDGMPKFNGLLGDEEINY